jgi:hypothetical protein
MWVCQLTLVKDALLCPTTQRYPRPQEGCRLTTRFRLTRALFLVSRPASCVVGNL